MPNACHLASWWILLRYNIPQRQRRAPLSGLLIAAGCCRLTASAVGAVGDASCGLATGTEREGAQPEQLHCEY